MFSNKALKKLILPLIIEQILIMAVGVAVCNGILCR